MNNRKFQLKNFEKKKQKKTNVEICEIFSLTSDMDKCPEQTCPGSSSMTAGCGDSFHCL